MSETNFDIDAAAEQFDKGKAPEGDTPPNHPEGKQEYDTHDGQPPAQGHQSYEEYLENGGDPDMYRGKKAFEKERERIDENKGLKKQIKSLETTVRQTTEAVGDLVQQARDETRAEIEARIQEAKENEDFDGYDRASQDLAEHDAKQKPQQQPTYQEPDVIVDFRAENPRIDAESDDYDEEYNELVEGAYNDLYHRMSNGGRKKLSDNQIKRLLNKAVREADDIFGEPEPGDADADADADTGADADADPGRSPRNNRRQGTSRRRAASREVEQGAEDFKINNPKNSRDHDATGVRDMIHKNAYNAAIKAGKSEEDATKAANEAAKEFERNLHK